MLPLIHPHHSLSLILRFSFSTFLLHTSLSLGCYEVAAVEMCNSAKPYFLIIGPCSIVTCCTRIIGTNTRLTTKGHAEFQVLLHLVGSCNNVDVVSGIRSTKMVRTQLSAQSLHTKSTPTNQTLS